MKRRAEYLVEKRDGTVQWLRATKLARSIQMALACEADDEVGRALDLAAAIVAGLRARTGGERLSTAAIAEATEKVLLATGFPHAALAYAEVGARRERQRRAFVTMARHAAVDAATREPRGSRIP